MLMSLNLMDTVMDHSQIEARATSLVEAAALRRPYERMEGTLDEAYAVQRRYVELAQARLECGKPVGYKIALTTRAMQTMVGVDQPLYGQVFESRVYADGTVLQLDKHQHIGVEFEVALRLGHDIHPSGTSHTRASIAANVDGLAVAYEFIEDRNADYAQINAFSLVADNCWNAGVVIGDYQLLDLSADATTELKINGEVVGHGLAGDALGHPLEALAWLANAAGAHGHVLRAGEFVMTGSSIRTTFPVPGDCYEFSVAGLGMLKTAFA
jgi:2-oxo-3-hexenedioate decarboxylase/2-keto-4-pentenoate hydratase